VGSGGINEPYIRWGSRWLHTKAICRGRTCQGIPDDTLPWAVHKWLNRSRCYSGCGLTDSDGPRKHVLLRVHTCVPNRGLFVKLLWPLVVVVAVVVVVFCCIIINRQLHQQTLLARVPCLALLSVWAACNGLLRRLIGFHPVHIPDVSQGHWNLNEAFCNPQSTSILIGQPMKQSSVDIQWNSCDVACHQNSLSTCCYSFDCLFFDSMMVLSVWRIVRFRLPEMFW